MKECPTSVIDTGRHLIKARRLADKMNIELDNSLQCLENAVKDMVTDNGAKIMQSGTAQAKIRQAQMAYGLIMEAHDSLRCVLIECDVEQPTDDQVASIR